MYTGSRLTGRQAGHLLTAFWLCLEPCSRSCQPPMPCQNRLKRLWPAKWLPPQRQCFPYPLLPPSRPSHSSHLCKHHGLGCPAAAAESAAAVPAAQRRYQPDCYLEFPRGGSQAMVDALVRGLEKHGGRLLLRSHVEQVLTEGGRATGE